MVNGKRTKKNKTKMKSKRQQYQQSFVHLWYAANILKAISKFKKKKPITFHFKWS